MPADHTLPQSSRHHRDAAAPYPCHAWPGLREPAWALQHGYCRHSLDSLYGAADPRCPADCRHRAPVAVREEFERVFAAEGAQAAADYTRRARGFA